MDQLSIEERLAKFRKEKTHTNPLLESTTTLSRRFVAFRNTVSILQNRNHLVKISGFYSNYNRLVFVGEPDVLD